MIKEKNLVENINAYLVTNKNLFANEIRMGIGIPDVMICLSQSTDSLFFDDYYYLKLISLLNDYSSHSLDSIYEKMNIPKRKINNIIDDLCSKDFLVRIDDNFVLKRKIDLINQGINVSIEVKIKDWKNGLIQAQRYLSFSDYSYLAIMDKYLDNVNLQEAQELGIGIISIDSDSISEICKPKRSNKCNSLFKNISLSFLQEQNDSTINNSFFSLCVK